MVVNGRLCVRRSRRDISVVNQSLLFNGKIAGKLSSVSSYPREKKGWLVTVLTRLALTLSCRAEGYEEPPARGGLLAGGARCSHILFGNLRRSQST